MRWRDDFANNRRHEETGKVPSLVFRHEEKHRLKPIPDTPFDVDDVETSTTATRMLNDLAGAEIHGQLERALRRYCRADFLAIDDFAVLAMDPAQANLAFQVISERFILDGKGYRPTKNAT
jgi:hypothetical protein